MKHTKPARVHGYCTVAAPVWATHKPKRPPKTKTKKNQTKNRSHQQTMEYAKHSKKNETYITQEQPSWVLFLVWPLILSKYPRGARCEHVHGNRNSLSGFADITALPIPTIIFLINFNY